MEFLKLHRLNTVEIRDSDRPVGVPYCGNFGSLQWYVDGLSERDKNILYEVFVDGHKIIDACKKQGYSRFRFYYLLKRIKKILCPLKR